MARVGWLDCAWGPAVGGALVAAVLAGGCSGGADEQSAICQLEDADGVPIDDAVVELRPDASGRLVARARLAESFSDESFGYVEGYVDDEGLDLRIIDGTLRVSVIPAASRWLDTETVGLIRVWERAAPECGRFATVKMLSE